MKFLNSTCLIVISVVGFQGIFIVEMALSQPVLSSKINVNGCDVYQDLASKNVFYYSPPEVKLKMNSSGSPAFLLLEMRYTGTHLYSDQNSKGFHNILQLSVILEPISTQVYDQIL